MANISPHCKEAQGKSQTVKVPPHLDMLNVLVTSGLYQRVNLPNFWPLDAKFNTVATVNLVVDVSEEGLLHL